MLDQPCSEIGIHDGIKALGYRWACAVHERGVIRGVPSGTSIMDGRVLEKPKCIFDREKRLSYLSVSARADMK